MKYQKSKFYRSLVAIALLANGSFQLLAPAMAEGTTAGETISNTATATYEDPNSPGTTLNTTSNTVTITVAEVAGITVSAAGIVDNNGGTVGVGDLLIYTYTITNVGNDPTTFRIPNLATTTGPGIVSGTLPGATTANNLQYSTDGGTTWIEITNTEEITPSVAPNGTVLVRVPITVQVGAQTGETIAVTLGNTPGNAQNQLRIPNGGDVYTVDNPDAAANEADGPPINGTREASAVQDIQVGVTAKTYALATILKVRSEYDNNATVNNITDDTLTYDLGLRVESNDVTGSGITPAPLAGTTINVDTVNGSYILVSDAIPAGTQLAAAPTPPTGWDAVYTTSDPATFNANTAVWKRFPLQGADTLAGITRVGFINKTNTITSIAPGTTVNGFSIQLAMPTATSPLKVINIAQLFGQTPGNDLPVYDESGDQNPSNFDGSTPPVGTDTNADGLPDDLTSTITDGLVTDTELAATGTDTSNNNTGTGEAGEANVFDVVVVGAASVLNGPQGVPNAIGPTDNNDDFTNKSALVPAGTAPGSTLDPQSVGFTNTLQNSGTDPGDITLEPTAPVNPLDLRDGTLVTLTYDAQSVIYTYDQGAGTFTTTGTPITIPNVAPGATINYGVEVNLPANTPLSTDTIADYAGDTEFGFPVRITATIDVAGTTTTNITIDRVYTGYLKLVKLSRILQGTGPAVGTGQDNFESTPAVNGIDPNSTVTDVPRTPAPGNIIEYLIRYTNISDAQAGTGNVILNADKIVITEDGTTGTNNWALDNDTNGQSDTSNIVGSAQDSGASTINFFSGNPATTGSIDQTGTTVNTDVTKYINQVTGIVAPGVQRTFIFQRKMN
ncbi:beta strand repeat-containing protein [Anabaena sp. PCC 7938]|uniref:DUF7925 domain-containing protein n=1 Tax=Anabaena cylindrica (strain ATCC 27899 / PCC 7122) TaxID=272123 RepID=K9ZJG7_ANACC|nr:MULTISPECIES: hypothetical protein [Anabaena]AFZ58485.1 hypothetical protein Anacy_3069 [Anabaena cylindrica PCC 7122]MCM2410015.1 hypothetical protein [Anabaena sp. CCAP 1446/1C]BAY04519.1 hypothetical protein NIES19_37840 [Anabaena cylindrica PCC 7122]